LKSRKEVARALRRDAAIFLIAFLSSALPHRNNGPYVVETETTPPGGTSGA
jgi:hypothetical protein